jgi:hypothetical protein
VWPVTRVTAASGASDHWPFHSVAPRNTHHTFLPLTPVRVWDLAVQRVQASAARAVPHAARPVRSDIHGRPPAYNAAPNTTDSTAMKSFKEEHPLGAGRGLVGRPRVMHCMHSSPQRRAGRLDRAQGAVFRAFCC